MNAVVSEPTTLDTWTAVLRLKSGVYAGKRLLGQDPAANSVDLPHLDESVSETPIKREKSGFVFFMVPLAKTEMEDAINRRDPTFVLEVSALDKRGKKWTVEKSLA